MTREPPQPSLSWLRPAAPPASTSCAARAAPMAELDLDAILAEGYDEDEEVALAPP